MTYYPNYQTTYKVCFAYSFNGKEKDYESGFHYYGSRYYSSEISMWLSTDPMADKYPNTSLYAYCSNNPIILVDPDGMDWFRSDKTGCVLWSNKNDKKIEHDGEFYRNIGTSYKEYKDGIIFQYGNSRTEASITEVNDEDRKFYFDGGQFIPSTFYTDDGTKVNISFLYNSPTGGNGDKPLSTEMVSALISAINDVNSGKNNKITMLDVSTTTTGKHSKNSSHYTQNGARAVDIDIINNIPLRNKNSHKLANRLQNAFDRLNVINYGPEHNWLQGHDNHIHANIKNR